MVKKSFFILIILLLYLIPFQGSALSLDEINNRIAELESKIVELQNRLRELKGENKDFYFKNRLKKGNKGENIKELQKFLNNNLDIKVNQTGPGSPGNETSYFGSLTEKAVIRFQEKYKKDILNPWGFKKGTGIVGATTRMKINRLLHEGEIEPNSFSISSRNPEQGDTIMVKLKNSNEETKLNFNDKEINFYGLGSNNEKIAFLPIGANYYSGFYSLVVKNKNGDYYFDYVNVKEKDFPKTTLKVTPELEEKGYNPDMIKDNIGKENKLLFEEVFSKESGDFYFRNSFVNPLDKIKNVGAYGNLRISGNVRLRHLGVDLEAEENTPVYSINNGLVVFAKEITDYGKTMVIDHGGGIRSLYLHLNKFLKDEGDKVNRGEQIALTGNTGYSIAPHLHLSINIYGDSIDPLKFLSLDF